MQPLNRRDILARTTAGIAAAALPGWFEREAIAAERERDAAQPKRNGANDQINIAVIGPGGSKGGFRQGLGDTRQIASNPGVKVVAVADVERQHREEAVRLFGSDCKGYNDFREVLARDDVDAVVIGTPDHWHTAVTIAALKAKKDVFCEKPLTLTIGEAQAIVNQQKKSKRIFQVGSQQRSDGRFRLACELVRNGRLGQLRRIEARLPNGDKGGPFQVKPVPEGFDWDMWLGPAPWTEYVPERTHGSFRHWYEYSGGMMTDWGAHHLDISQWGMGTDGSGPVKIESTGVLSAMTNGYNAARDFTVTYTYANGVKLIAMSEGENGVKFEGDAGWIFVSRGKIEASNPAFLTDPLPSSATKLYVSNNHYANFVDGVRNRKECICPAEVGASSVIVCHLGTMSLRLGGRTLEWDPEAGRFKGDDEANNWISRPYRKPWKL